MQYLPAHIFKRILAVVIDHLIVITLLTLVYTEILHPDFDQSSIILNYTEYLILFTINFIYFFALESIFGKTIGKKIFNLEIRGTHGKKADIYQTFIRNLIRPIDFIGFYLLGFIFVVYTPHNQRIGDLAAKTVVVESI
ncbi:RDD family protein [Patescibacteria group bacterium]|nr:RDD family protein [Patescibacteria group bacterium]